MRISGPHFLQDLVHRGLEFAQQRAADTTAAQLGDPHVFAFDHLGVDGDLAEFVHHDGDLRRFGGQNMPQQRGLTAAQRTRDQRNRSARWHAICNVNT